ncbi:hypothetical protein [Glaciihabitans sp. INWT7]|uniref:hypothetical protein n=1 Tax=Glaciihabitans sp. INWT7 TaxID=2596912 RepID=UPI001624A51B|nr:hypothetical protein [Glaciihabitans sp. INWT7]
MTTKTPNIPAAASGRSRPRPAVILDIIVAIAFSLVGLIFMLALASFYADQFLLPVFGIFTKILAVGSWFAGTALFIFFEVRGRWAFYWPLVGIVAMFAFYYLVLFIASRVAA